MPNVSFCNDIEDTHYNPEFFCRLTLNDGNIVNIEGEGVLSSSVTQSYSASCVGIEVGNLCTSIGSAVFNGFSGASSVEMHNNVKSIGASAFTGCRNIVSVRIPSGVTNINNYTFSGCSKLESVEIPSGVTSIGSSAFNRCSGLTSVHIPNGVKSIGAYVWGYCTKLSSITIPDTVTSIGRESFTSCPLTEFTFPPLLTVVQTEFLWNTNIVHLNVHDGIKELKFYAFYGMFKLVDITLGVGVKNIPEMCFGGCTVLKTVIIKNSSCTLANTDAFANTPMVGSGVGKIYVPYGYGEEFKGRANWSTYAGHIYELDENGNIPNE